LIEQKLATGEHIAKERFAVSRKNTKAFLSDLGSAAVGFRNCIDDNEENVWVNAVSEILYSIVDVVQNVIDWNEGNNLRAENVLSVLSHYLSRLQPRHV
jgi:hypothetical protein